MPHMRFKVQLRQIDSGARIELPAFLRLAPVGSEAVTSLSDMTAGTRILWDSKKYEVMQ